jgi:hypothetical protein
MRNQGKLLRAFQAVEDYFVGQVEKFSEPERQEPDDDKEMSIAA